MSENHGQVVAGSLHSLGDEGVVRMNCKFEANVDELWSAFTDPQRLARWYGEVSGDLRLNGEFTAVVFASGWDGHGSIDICDPRARLEVTMWEEEDKKHVVAAELTGEEGRSTLALEIRGIDLDVLFAYGAGWQLHAEDLGEHLAGRDYIDRPTRWDELEPTYRAMAIVPM